MGKDLKGKEIGTGISQRADGMYMARFVDRYKKRHTFYDRDLKALRKRLEREKYEAEQIFMGERAAITVTEWFEEFLILYKKDRVKNTTYYRIQQTYSPCREDVLGTLKLREVRAVHVQMLINKLHEDGYTHGTLKLLKSLLKEMFKMAMGNGYMLVNPCDAVILPKKESNEPRFLTEKEQAMFMEVAVEYQHYDIFCADLCSGMRIGELLGLKWSDIDFENKVIRIKRTLHYAKLKEEEACHFFFTTPKTETSERTIPMLPEMEVILRRVKSKQLRSRLLAGKKWNQKTEFEDMVFTSQYGAPVRYGDVNRTIKLAVVKANIQEAEVAKYEDREPYVLKPFSPHCFRHTFVTRCKTKGIPYEVIKPYVGHSNTATTMYYDHTKEEIDMSKLQKVSFLGVV